MKQNTNTTEEVHRLLLADIIRSATNRKVFKPETLEEMAASIREKGVVQPILVRLVSDIEDEERRKAAGSAKYEIVYGERRWRGSKIAGQTAIPAIIRKLTDHEALKLQVIENAQREDLDVLDEAEQLSPRELGSSRKASAGPRHFVAGRPTGIPDRWRVVRNSCRPRPLPHDTARQSRPARHTPDLYGPLRSRGAPHRGITGTRRRHFVSRIWTSAEMDLTHRPNVPSGRS